MKRVSLASTLVLVLVVPSVALAQPAKTGDAAAAQSLFDQGRTLMASNRYAEACPKFEESLRLDAGIGTAYNLADCNEHLGKLATAWAGFLSVAAQAKARKQTERENVARKHAQALEKRVPKLVIEAPSSIVGLEVKRDGIAVGPGAWGSEIAVDPGAHVVVATAPGREQWQMTVQANESKVTHVSVPRDLRLLPAPVATPAAITTAPVASTPPPEAPAYIPPAASVIDERKGAPQRTLGFAVAGIGAAGLAVGGIFGLMSLSKRNESSGHCQGDACDAQGVSLRDSAIRNGNIATAATIAGGAVLATGLVLTFTAPRGEQRDALRIAPQIASRSGGVILQGTLP